MSSTIHVAVNIDYLLGHTDAQLARWLVPPVPMSGAQLRALLWGLKAQGYECVPPCDDYDGRGLCRGHRHDTAAAGPAGRGVAP